MGTSSSSIRKPGTVSRFPFCVHLPENQNPLPPQTAIANENQLLHLCGEKLIYADNSVKLTADLIKEVQVIGIYID